MNDLEQRLAALEARVERLEPSRAGTRGATGGELWALEELHRRIGGADGAVLFTGTVPLPGGARAEWQSGVPTDAILASDWADAVAPLDALAHRVRLALLREVLDGTTAAAELQERAGLGTTGQLYHHLRQLVSAGWLRQTTRGHYSVPPERVVPLLVVLAAARP